MDHHHFRHPQWRNLPDLHFYPIPSYNVPMGVMLPKNTEGLIVAEKSVSVSNLVNGTTRLQPVVLQLGQAAGALAALSQLNDIPVKEVDIRKVQEILLASGCYIMPYLDLPSDHPHFKVLQRIGVTGILRGEGRNVGWANQTWFRAEDPLLAEDLYLEEFLHGDIGLDEGAVTVGEMMTAVRNLGGRLSSASDSECWKSLGLDSYDPERVATRLEAAVVIDSAFDPFNMLKVDYNGNYIR